MYRIQESQLISKIKQFPLFILLIIFLIVSFGIIILYSAAGGSINPWASKQLIYFLSALPIVFIISIIDIKYLYKSAYFFYLVSLSLVIIVHITGHTAMGATRWINLGFIKIQPSELMKLSLIFVLARYFHKLSESDVRKIRYLIPPLLFIFMPFILILKQPDLGTAMIMLLLAAFIFFAAGVAIWKFVTIMLFASAAGPIIWNLLHDYQKNRILIFLDPELDPLGAGYNITQSKIAIGAGGLFGKGLLEGTQSQLNFLPEHQTDFIFTMLLEETGFIGGIILLFLYAILMISAIIIAINAASQFARLLAIGCCSMIFLHIFINTAMVMGLLPVVGVPLPFVTYGGTMMITTMLAFGIIFNVHIHTNERNFSAEYSRKIIS